MSLYEHGFDETSDQGTNGTNANYSDGFGDSSMNAGSSGNGNANNNWNQADQTREQSSWQQSSDQSWQNTNSQSSDQTWQNTNTQNANQNAGENSYGYNNGNNGAPFGQYQSKAESKKARKMNRKARRAAARQARKNKPIKHPTGRKFGMAIALGLVFGVVASFTFGGTNYLTRKATGDKADTTATLTTNKGKIQSTSTSSATTVTDVSDIVSNVMPSIVQVTNISIQDYQNFFGMNQQKQVESAGSGIIISEDNDYLYIATNNHVVSNTRSLTITFNDNQAVSGEVQGTAESSDLAVIKVKLSDIPSSTRNNIKIATLGSSDDLTVGESAIVIGNALGYGQSVTTGVISALNREVSLQDESGNTIKNKLIQTDAAVNPGNSGGAMLNMKGEVVGIVSAKYSDTEVEGMGYAIPISSASTIIDKLMKGESITDSANKSDTKNYGYSEKTATVTLGSEKNLQIYCMDITSDQSSQYQVPAGILVSQIIKDGAADKAGMEAGDIITKIGDKSVSTTQELKNILSEKKAGEKVEITYLRKADSTSSGNSGNSGNSGSSGNSNSRGNSFFDFFGY